MRKKLINQRRLDIRQLGRARDPKEIPYFQRVALDPSEDLSVRKEALVALGNLGERSLKPLKDISEKADDITAASARKLLHAFYRNNLKTGWSREAKAMLDEIVVGFSLMVEGPAV